MLGIAVGVVALLVALSTVFYFGIMSLLLWKLAVEGPDTRRKLGPHLISSFFQNYGIPIAILGFSFRSTEMVVLAGLLLSLAMLLRSDTSISLHPSLEVPLLGLALATLGAVGLFYALI